MLIGKPPSPFTTQAIAATSANPAAPLLIVVGGLGAIAIGKKSLRRSFDVKLDVWRGDVIR